MNRTGLALDFKKSLLTAIALGLLNYASVAQSPSTSFDLKKMLPTSPEAATIAKFGDIPIGLYTGTADVSIPMYTIKEGGLEIPIVLKYHGSGVKVEDQANNVGLDWSLEPGGAIIQIVTGKQDALDQLITADPAGYSYLMANRPTWTLWHSSRAELGFGVFPCIAPGFDGYFVGDTRQTLEQLKVGDGQPDIYQYDFPGGYSGKFYMNPITHLPVLIDKSSDITFSSNTSGLTAKTLDGTVFTFSDQETATTSVSSEYTGFTWKLTKINFNNGKEIKFNYENGYYQWFTYNETYHSEYPFNFEPAPINNVVPHWDISNHYTKNLRRITTSNMMIQFNYEDRDDLLGNADNDGDNSNGVKSVKRIKSVDIKTLNSDTITYTTVKTFQMDYDYFQYNNVGGTYMNIGALPVDVFGKRLKLVAVREIGYNSSGATVSNPPYTFQYNETVTLPLKTSFARDYWGYYNGVNNTKLIPDLTAFNRIIRSIPMPSNIISAINGANRAVDKTLMKAYSLTKVTYPTGGFTEFDYEPHSFVGRDYPDKDKLGSTLTTVDVMDQNESNNTKSQQFSLSQAMNVQFNFYISAGHPDQGLGFYDVSPSTIILESTTGGVTSTLRTWQISNTDFDTFNNNGKNLAWNELMYIGGVGTTYTLKVELPDVLGGQANYNKGATVRAGFQYYDTPGGNNQLSFGGGLRISEIRNFDSPNVLASKKRIRYINEDNTSSGKIMSDVENVDVRNMLFMKRDGSTFNFNVGQASIWFVSSESILPYSASAGGSNIGYSRVVEEDLSTLNSSSKGAKIFYYRNQEAITAPNLPDIPDLLNGRVLKDEIRNSTGALMQENTYTYEDKESHVFYGVKVNKDFIEDFNGGDCYFTAPPSYHSSYVYNYYPIYSSWYQTTSKNSKHFENGNLLTTNETYQYNTKGQLVAATSNDSRSRLLTTEFLYPSDNPSDAMSSSLIAQGLYDHLQRQTSKIGNVETFRLDINYRIEDGRPVQDDIIRRNKDGNPYVEISFDKYGPFKTLKQFTKDGPPSSILWSYANSKPIASFSNVSYSTLESLLGGSTAVNRFSARVNPTKAEIDEFLIPVSGFFLTRYVYDAATGLTSQTDPKGMTTYYDYDEMLRLKNIKDQNGYIIKNFKYNYHQ